MIGTTRRHVGAKYEQGRRTVEVAKLVRADIKSAIKEGKFPKGLKVSVKVESFAGGSSLYVTPTEAEATCFNPEFWKHLNVTKGRPFPGPRPMRYTEEGTKLLADLETIAKAYMFSESDPMSDYYNCNFYLHVEFGRDLESTVSKAMEAEFCT